MRLQDAFQTIERWSREGEDVGACRRRHGYVVIDRGGIERQLIGCPVCGALTGAGDISVSHDDGRRVLIAAPLYHYAEVGHAISQEQLDSDLLFAILWDADRPPSGLRESTPTIAEALKLVRDIGQRGEKVGPYVRRSGRIMVHPGAPTHGVQYCIHCGQQLSRGQVTVAHEDRRMVSFDPAVYHYTEAGHPITGRDLDVRRLVAMIADR